MAKQTIGLGSAANDNTGDTLRVGGDKVNDNFNEIYAALGNGSTLTVSTNNPAVGQVLRYNGSTFLPSDYTNLTGALDTNGNSIVSSNNNNAEIKVSKLAKPSLGSLGVKTEVNNLMGLNIWQNLKIEEIIEHLNYIPDISASKHLQIFLNELYISASVPPKGVSNQILKFLETRLFKIKNSGQSKNLYKWCATNFKFS